MAKVLVADDEADIRALLVDALFDAGHDVLEAADGGAAVETASLEHPDLILLDVSMPVMDGFQALRALRENPDTESIPVIMLTVLPPKEGEQDALNLGVSHYLTKPWNPQELELTIKVALRAAQPASVGSVVQPKLWSGSTAHRKAPGQPGAQRFIGMDDALSLMGRKLGGGIPVGSLTLIEGPSSSGKSVVCQHLAHGALNSGFSTAYFTTEHTSRSFVKQMNSIGIPISRYLQDGRLSIFPVEEAMPDEDNGPMLGALAVDIDHLPQEYEFLIIDSISNLAGYSQDHNIVGFFSSLKGICAKGRTIVVVCNSHAFDQTISSRLNAVCDSHLKFRTGKIRDKVMRVAEVVKANCVEMDKDNIIPFEVEAGIGIHIIPVSQAKA